MKIKKWIIINSRGSCRFTTKKPGLDGDEVSILLSLEIPDALFNKPRLEASIAVPDESVRSDIINTVVCENVQEAINQASGLDFAIRIVPDEQEMK